MLESDHGLDEAGPRPRRTYTHHTHTYTNRLNSSPVSVHSHTIAPSESLSLLPGGSRGRWWVREREGRAHRQRATFVRLETNRHDVPALKTREVRIPAPLGHGGGAWWSWGVPGGVAARLPPSAPPRLWLRGSSSLWVSDPALLTQCPHSPVLSSPVCKAALTGACLVTALDLRVSGRHGISLVPREKHRARNCASYE